MAINANAQGSFVFVLGYQSKLALAFNAVKEAESQELDSSKSDADHAHPFSSTQLSAISIIIL